MMLFTYSRSIARMSHLGLTAVFFDLSHMMFHHFYYLSNTDIEEVFHEISVNLSDEPGKRNSKTRLGIVI